MRPFEVFENLFVHEGAPGHEIVFVAPVRILHRGFDPADPVPSTDDELCLARWFALEALKRGEPTLLPAGLASRLDAVL